MSTLKTNTLTGTTSAGSIVVTGEGGSTTTNLQQGLAKVWFNYTMVTTTAFRDSFNCSGLTDNGSGDTTLAFTSSLSNNDYALSLANRRNSTTEGQSITPHQDTEFGTGEIRLATEGAEDFLGAYGSIHGDLA
tara:strand:+ start:2226 stop:2624 length:399 start_codon:yes stop_codon:yes gene_type:complete